MNRKQRRAERASNRASAPDDANPLDQLCKRLVAQGKFATEEEALKDVIRVFTMHMRGELHPVDAQAARKVVDSEAEAFADAPGLMGALTLLARGNRKSQ